MIVGPRGRPRPHPRLAMVALAGALLALPSVAQSQADPVLQQKLEAAIAGFDGTVGVYVHHLGTGQWAAIRADELFPTASMIKLPILVALFDAVQRGTFPFDTVLTYRDSLLYEGEDILGSFRDSSAIPLSQVALLMITTSDNTAALWLQRLVGTGTAVNSWLAAHGFDSTRVNSRTPGRRGNWGRYGWGQTTPREIATLLTAIRRGGVVSPAASEAMYRMLTRIYWNGEALSQLPPTVQAASKQGAVDRSRSEVVLVNAPSGDFAFAVLTREQADTSWTRDNAGYALLRRISALLWEYFEPGHPYHPPSGASAFAP